MAKKLSLRVATMIDVIPKKDFAIKAVKKISSIDQLQNCLCRENEAVIYLFIYLSVLLFNVNVISKSD